MLLNEPPLRWRCCRHAMMLLLILPLCAITKSHAADAAMIAAFAIDA